MPVPAQSELRTLLKRVLHFADLADAELDALLAISTTRRLRAREVLFHKGTAGSDLFVIMRGRLKVATGSERGKELVFRIMDPGEVIGEIALLDGHRRSATITALEPVELLVIHRRELLDFLRHQPEVAIKLLGFVAARLRSLSELLEATTFLNVPSRLARKLLALAHAYGRRGPAGHHIELGLSQQDLGEMVGTSRESVNKQMRAWTEAGVLSMDRHRITLYKQEVLQRLAGYSID